MLQALEQKNKALTAVLALEKEGHITTKTKLSTECAKVASLNTRKECWLLTAQVRFADI